MRSYLLSTVALVGLTAAASAADLPSRRAPAPYVAVPVFTWTGFYIGGNVGGGEGNFGTRNTGVTGTAITALAAGNRPTTFNNDHGGFMGGGQVGYNYQIGAFVLGLEADADYTDFSGTRFVTTPNGAGATQNNSVRSDLHYLGTVRGRVGYAFDRLLVYGTGGFAYGDVYNRETFFNAAGAVTNNGARSRTGTGWAAGAGVEYALATDNFLNFFHTSAVTIKAEYLHYDLGRSNYGLFSPAGVLNYTARTRTDGDLGRIGLNYKF